MRFVPFLCFSTVTDTDRKTSLLDSCVRCFQHRKHNKLQGVLGYSAETQVSSQSVDFVSTLTTAHSVVVVVNDNGFT